MPPLIYENFSELYSMCINQFSQSRIYTIKNRIVLYQNVVRWSVGIIHTMQILFFQFVQAGMGQGLLEIQLEIYFKSGNLLKLLKKNYTL